MKNEQIAQVCHEANRAYCQSIGDNSQPQWDTAPKWQRDSALKGVEFCLSNPDAPASHNHDSWLKEKVDNGWKYGPVKDPEKKEHPCIVPYDKLPIEQKRKDSLFKAIVGALSILVVIALTGCNTPLGPIIVQNAATAGCIFGTMQYPSSTPYLQAARDLICQMAGKGVLDPAQIIDELDSKISELKTPQGAAILQGVLNVYEAFYYQFKDRISTSSMAAYLVALCDGMTAGLPVDAQAQSLKVKKGWPQLRPVK